VLHVQMNCSVFSASL